MNPLAKHTVRHSGLLITGLIIGCSAIAQESAPEAMEARAAADAAQQVAAREQQAARSQARALSAEAARNYEQALRAAEAEQREALKAVSAARKELSEQGRRERAMAEEQRVEAREARAAERIELNEVRRELERAHDNLRRASREVARVHRDIAHPRQTVAPRVDMQMASDNRAVIGVILGENERDGVKVLGVSPDGPAERAGLAPGDVIVSIMGEDLGEAGDQRALLTGALAGIEAGDELLLGVRRNDENIEHTLVAEKREPFTWHSVTRLASSNDDPQANIFVERIDLPELDREKLEVELERMRGQLEKRRIIIDTDHAPLSEEAFVFEFDEFSDMGGAALSGTNIWFGMRLTHGLKMAELGPELGDYFSTDQGVLILKAREDNELLLRSGDVILAVGGIPVERPADIARALRNLEPESEVDIEIMRQKKRQTLTIELPDLPKHFGFEDGGIHQFKLEIAPEVAGFSFED